MTTYSTSSKVRAAAELERRKRASIRFYGSNLEAMMSMDKEVITSGPAGTGKSTGWLQRIHIDARNYSLSRQLVLRETRASLTTSGLVTFEDFVLGRDNPLVTDGPSRAHRDSYRYPNGSEVVIGGMDNITKHMSTDYDRIFVQEAIEGSLTGWEELTTRLRNGRLPCQQLCGDTNPSYPDHWLKKRCDNGKTRMIIARHEDNPRWYNHDTETWTPEGLAYIETLDALTGARYWRLRHGKWTQAEGVIFDNFDEALNVTNEAEYNPTWPVIWGVDDGYAEGEGEGTASHHPRVVLMMNITPQGGLNVFYEYYKTRELSEDTVANVLELPYNRPDCAYVDSSAAELKTRLHMVDIPTVNATHKVSEGIKNLRRLMCDSNGVRLFKIHPRCTQLIREFNSYQYDARSTVSMVGEPKPLKVSDHGVDSARYASRAVWYGGD
jgi:PBSX family phage terminase large subunit